MKRVILWLVIACMLTIPAAAEDGFDGYTLLDMCCVNAGTFAFAAQDEILIMKDGLIADRTQCKDAERIDCALYAMPQNSPCVWSLNESEFARLGLALPQDGWTWDDLLSLARQAKQIDDTIYTVDMDAMNYLLEQALRSCVDLYMGKVDLDTPQFRHALEIYKALYEEGHVMWALSDEPVLCTAQTPLQTGASAYLIPTKAAAEGSVLILQQRQGYFGNEYTAKLVSVQTGDTSGDWIEITGGLNAGDIVIIEADRDLRDGDRVMHEIK